MDWLDSRGFLIDLDGTLISGQSILPDARWLLESVHDRYAIVSNNAEHTPGQLAGRLRRLGLHVAEDRLVLAGACALEMLAKETDAAKVMVVGSSALRSYAERLGLVVTNDRPDFVVVMRDRKFSYGKLALAANALHRGAQMVLTCPDISHPGVGGSLVPEAGAIAASILACAGRSAPDILVGKPQPLLYMKACDRLELPPADTVMIGDNPATDGEGASRLGMPFVHVRNGQIRKGCCAPFANTGEDVPTFETAV